MAYTTVFCVLLAALCPFNALALSISPPNTLNQFHPTALTLLSNGTIPPRTELLGGTLNCKPSSKYIPYTRRPSIRDCGQAIRRLPSSGDVAEFKTINRIQPMYRMPQVVPFGSCKVTVDLKPGSSSCMSSWTEIGMAATESILACMKGTHTGGTSTCGEQDKIDIKLEWIKNDDPEDLQLGDGPEMTDAQVYQALTGNIGPSSAKA